MAEFLSIFARMFDRAVTYRRYGDKLQYRRPMIHRWSVKQVKGSVSIAELMAENIVMRNPLFERLLKRGKNG